MKIFYLSIPLTILAMSLACGGGSSSSSTPAASTPVTPAAPKGFTLKTGFSATSIHASADVLRAAGHGLAASVEAAGTLVDPSTVTLLMGIESAESGSLVCGLSGGTDTLSFAETTVMPDGTTVGCVNGHGVSQTFSDTDISILPLQANHFTGPLTLTSPQVGCFMAHFSAAGSTEINMAPLGYTSSWNGSSSNTSITEVNEVVMRIAHALEPVTDSNGNDGTIITGMHFSVGTQDYSDETQNLTVSGQTGLSNVQYILFVPASQIGLNTTALITGSSVVMDPLANDSDHVSSTSYTLSPTNTWVAQDPLTWIYLPGNAGLLTFINTVVAADPTKSFTTLASYFQNFFIKYNAAECTLFAPASMGSYLGSGTFPADIEIISLNDLPNGPGTPSVPMPLSGSSVLNMVYNAGNTAYTINNGVLDLEGQPPVLFTTSVVTQ
jgi:hypothetical protein